MQYRNNNMPVTCSAYGNLPIPHDQGAFLQMPAGSFPMSAQHPMPGMSPLPTGVPVGGPGSAAVPTGPAVVGGAAAAAAQVPVTVENVLFTPGFLRTQIGRRVRVEFLLGTNLLTDRTGTLVAVGASYIIIRLIDSDDLMLCDIYSIKFVTIIL